MPRSDRSPSDQRLITTVARRYYLDDESKVQIASDLGISRFKVARLLDEARATGVVRIEIAPEAGSDEARGDRLASALGLTRAVVVDLSLVGSRGEAPDPRARRRELGRVAAHVLHQAIGPQDVLGLPSSRTVAAMMPELRDLPRVPVVQLSGALALDSDEVTSVDVVRDAARVSGGPAHQFYAPLVATDRASARMLRRQPSIADTFAKIPEVTVAVVGVGAWAPGESTLYALATDAEHRALSRAGAVGEISGAFFDADGAAVHAGIADRVISVGTDQLRAIPDVIGIALGPARTEVVRAAAGAGLVDSLVCDVELADALLDGAGEPTG
ncbi:sugar-binding transcriptional regulator [Barrientosiimonas humi]|uniref:sugar-binding transcriptional regulator n=1 Tax=Barrientosiimonas humi TaxID=999931 RepID=UPI00370D0963